jgi:hypothetical protein
MPYVLVITLLESVELAVICSPIRVDLRLFVSLENAPHCPFTIDESTVTDIKGLPAHAARAPYG